MQSNLEFECSAAPITFADDKEEDRKHREGVEFYLLWHYRLEFGASTRCNYGRFHASYLKSSDRKKGIRGYRLSDDMPPNPAGGPGLPPLHLDGHPFENNWMGLEWTAPHTLERVHIRSVTTGPGVYKLFDQNKQELLYIGESYNVQNRLSNHERKLWGAQHPLFSYVQLPFGTPGYQRHEIENDLIAGFYDQTKTIPTFQLVNHNLRRSASDT